MLRSVHAALRVWPGSSLAVDGVRYYPEEGSAEASMKMTGPLAAVVLGHTGNSAAILAYMERRDVHPYKVNVAGLVSNLAKQAA